jgi:hypothetical protein
MDGWMVERQRFPEMLGTTTHSFVAFYARLGESTSLSTSRKIKAQTQTKHKRRFEARIRDSKATDRTNNYGAYVRTHHNVRLSSLSV